MIIGRIRNGKYLQLGDPEFDSPSEDRPIHGMPAIRSDKPHTSTSAAIHVDQVAQFNRECVRGVSYDPRTGNMISTSSGAREREARRRGKSFG